MKGGAVAITNLIKIAGSVLAWMVVAIDPSTAAPCATLPEAPAATPRQRPYEPNVKSLIESLGARPEKTIIMGDSLVGAWSGDDLDKLFHGGAVKFAAGGDTTANLLWRIQKAVKENAKYEQVVVLIGTNDLPLRSACGTASGIIKVVDEILSRAPNAHAYVLTLLPRGKNFNQFADKILVINDTLKSLQKNRVTVVDANADITQPCGGPECQLRDDYLHLTPRGYKALTDLLQKALSQRRLGGASI